MAISNAIINYKKKKKQTNLYWRAMEQVIQENKGVILKSHRVKPT